MQGCESGSHLDRVVALEDEQAFIGAGAGRASEHQVSTVDGCPRENEMRRPELFARLQVIVTVCVLQDCMRHYSNVSEAAFLLPPHGAGANQVASRPASAVRAAG